MLIFLMVPCLHSPFSVRFNIPPLRQIVKDIPENNRNSIEYCRKAETFLKKNVILHKILLNLYFYGCIFSSKAIIFVLIIYIKVF